MRLFLAKKESLIMFETPILFLIFNRPDTTEKVFQEIKNIKPKQLFIAADGPRSEEEQILCKETRDLVLNNIDWDCEVKTLFRDENLGLRLAVSQAISWFFENVEQGIILEDDTVPSKSFFSFTQAMLERYKDNKNIMCINGENVTSYKFDASYDFVNLPLPWGWASWRRAWKYYDGEMSDFENFRKNKSIKSIFKNGFHQKDWLKYLEMVKNGKINSWNYAWTYSVFKNQGLCIIPSVNLVSNIGYDKRGSHTFDSDSPLSNFKRSEISKDLVHPKKLKVNHKLQECLCKERFDMPSHFSLNRYEFFRQNKLIREIKRALHKMGLNIKTK